MVFKNLEVLFNFEGAALTNSRRKTKIFLLLISGDNSEEDTPVPIPNTEVKLFSADDTWREAAREIRTSPVRIKGHSKGCLFCYIYLKAASENGSVTWAAKRAVETGCFLPLLFKQRRRSSSEVKRWKEYCSILVTRAVESGKFAYRTARDCNKEQ